MLEINFLSKDKLILDGKIVDDKVGSKAIVILALLIISEKKTLSREKIIDTLWPNSTEDAAKYNLRFNLWRISKAIDAQKNNGLILTYKGNCYINPKYEYICDVERIVGMDAKRCDDGDKLREILELFDCDFLDMKYYPECAGLNEKIIMQRYILDNKKLEICKRYIELSYRKKEYTDCMWALDICDELDPYDEVNAQRKLSILIHRKEYGRAIKYYQIFHGRLVHDIGMEPSKETKFLLDKINKNGSLAKEAGRKVIRCEIHAIEGVKFYWIADMVRSILSQISKERLQSLPKEVREILSFVQYRCGESPRKVSDAALVDATLTFLFLLCKDGGSVEIAVNDPKSLGQVDKNVMKHIKLRTKGRVDFRC